MQGASAIQNVLRQFPTGRVRVLVVWEPVLLSDWAAPTTGMLSRIADRRAAQFWDRGRVISQKIRSSPVVWDYVAVFPPGIRWEGPFPAPEFTGYPAADAADGLRQDLAIRLPQ